MLSLKHAKRRVRENAESILVAMHECATGINSSIGLHDPTEVCVQVAEERPTLSG